MTQRIKQLFQDSPKKRVQKPFKRAFGPPLTLGELFDHIGVELERSSHQIAAKDLKALGAILRSNRPCVDTKLDLSWAQERLGPLADRYGIKPVNGRPYGLRQLIRVAEEVIESTLKPAKACT